MASISTTDHDKFHSKHRVVICSLGNGTFPLTEVTEVMFPFQTTSFHENLVYQQAAVSREKKRKTFKWGKKNFFRNKDSRLR